MLILNDIALDELILSQPFACDVAKCKGACCTLSGGSGAPLREEEIAHVEKAKEAASNYLTASSRQYIEENGWLSGPVGERTVQCIDDKQCVFVFYEKDVARCSIERAYFAGESEFRKPISCHLFPIRVANFGGTYLFYDKFSECEPAIENGRKTGKTILDTTREALEREFGEEWVDAAQALKERKK